MGTHSPHRARVLWLIGLLIALLLPQPATLPVSAQARVAAQLFESICARTPAGERGSGESTPGSPGTGAHAHCLDCIVASAGLDARATGWHAPRAATEPPHALRRCSDRAAFERAANYPRAPPLPV